MVLVDCLRGNKIQKEKEWAIVDESTIATEVASSLEGVDTGMTWEIVPDVYTAEDFEILFDVVKSGYERRWGR